MPIYMDRHDVSDEVTAENVAEVHQADLKIQHKFDCRGLTYWFDGKRKTAFCLIEAPNKEAIKKMHEKAHGLIPHKIIEVNGNIVESFLGRIEDPEKAQNTELNIINDPTFRTIMVTELKKLSLKNSDLEKQQLSIHNYNESVAAAVNKLKGNIVRQKTDCYLVSFDSITNAVLCALEIRKNMKQATNNNYDPDIILNIGLSAGIPVTEKEGFFEDTISMAERLCEVVKGKIVISSEVKDLYESENLNISIDEKYVEALNPADEEFLINLMDFTEREWSNTALNVDNFSRKLGYSKSQLYRKMISITGKSPNKFIKEYRLKKALKLLDKQIGNISEIAFTTGFNSPAYFSKCFQETYGVLPSTYTKQSVGIQN